MSGDDTMQHDAQRKAFTTAQAEAALRGCELHVMVDGTFLLTKWNLCRALPDLAAVEVALLQMGGRP